MVETQLVELVERLMEMVAGLVMIQVVLALQMVMGMLEEPQLLMVLPEVEAAEVELEPQEVLHILQIQLILVV